MVSGEWFKAVSIGVNMADSYEVLQRFCPDVLERHELPHWFIRMADSRSKGKLAFIVWDREQLEEIIHADYYYDGDYLETKTFGLKLKR